MPQKKEFTVTKFSFFGLHPSANFYQSIMFQKPSLLSSSGKDASNMSDHLHQAKGSTSIGVPCLEREGEPASKT